MPQVSVVMPFHKVTPFLRPAIRSILGQTLPDLELLLVDNGTGLERESLGDEGRDPRLKIIRHDRNRGVAEAHNAAQAAAGGEFIANMDSDDLARPDRLARQLAALRADPGLGLLATHAQLIDEHDRVTGSQFTLGTDQEQRVFSAYSLPITNPSLMGRREVFLRFPMRPEFAISSDYDFFARAIETTRAGCLAEPLLQYRVHPGQVTQRERPEMVFNACLIRLLTARRRAGQPEGAAELLASVAEWRERAPAPALAYAEFARRALAEGHHVLAVFLARRAFAADRRARSLARACRVLVLAIRGDPRGAAKCVRMFATGPVRALGLRPLPAADATRAGG